MRWITGVRQEGGRQHFLTLTQKGEQDHIEVASLSTVGVPTANTLERTVFTGVLSGWTRTPSKRYLEAFGFAVPDGMEHQHSVYCHQLDDGTTLHVPALAFIRALYKPHRLLLPVIFSPANIDIFGFVDYSSAPPVVILDKGREKYLDHRQIEDRYEPLRWLHSSRSARACSQSVFTNSLNGCVDLALPLGQFRLVMHGRLVGSELFVTKVAMITASVEATDSVTGSEEAFLFHRMAGPERAVPTLSALPPVPTRLDGLVTLTDAEWVDVEELLNSQRRRQRKHSWRELLDVILQKLSGGSSWKSVARSSGFSETILTTTFRRWQLDGRLAKVLNRLELARLGG